MPVDETLQNLAFELTDEAESYLDNGNYSEAILKFQQALDLFQKAGLDAIQFEKARQMILKRQKKAMDLDQDSKKKKSITQNKDVSAPISTPPTGEQDLVNDGLDLLEEAEELLDAGRYNEAVQYFYSASEILKTAGWTQEQLTNIKNVVDTILEMLGQSGQSAQPLSVRSQESTQAKPMFVPTFMKTDQKDIIDPSSKQGQPRVSQPYIPSYLKVSGKQPDFIPEQERRHPNQQTQAGYQPSFLKSGQKDYTPQEKSKNQTGRTRSDGQYIPTFAKQEQESAQFDGTSVKKALSLASEGKPFDFSEISSEPHEGEPASISSPKIDQKLSPNTPMFIIVEKRKSVEKKTQDIMKLFKEKQETQQAKLQSVFDIIDKIRDNEQDRKFNLAISQLNNSIEKIKEIPGWTDQATVLYAWLIVLKEKQRINFDPRDENVIFDFGKIRSEFNKIMEDSLALSSSSEVTISFNDLINQELTAEQLYKSKIENEAEIQGIISQLLVEGKNLADKENFVESITKYNKASLLFNNLEWYEQIKQIKEIIEELAVIQKINDQVLIKVQGKSIEGLEAKQIKSAVAKNYKNRQERIAYLEDQKGKQHTVQDEAFSMINKAEKLFHSQNYDESIGLYKKAVNLLLTVGWESQIPTIHDRISEIRYERDKFILQVQKAYQDELDRKEETQKLQDQFQQLIQEKIEEGPPEQTVVKEDAQQDYEVHRQKLESVQKRITTLLESADNYSNVHQFSQAYETIAEAKTVMLEHNWKDQLSFLENFSLRIKHEEELYKKKLQLEQANEQKVLQNQLEFENFLNEQSQIIEKERAEKQAKLMQFQSKQKEQHQIREDAFKYMEEAETAMAKNQYENAIDLYQRANQLFLEIGWNIDINSQIQKVAQEKSTYIRHIKEQEDRKLALENQKRQIEQKKEQKKAEVDNAFQDVKSMLRAMKSPVKQEEEIEKAKKVKAISAKEEAEAKAKAKKELSDFRAMIKKTAKR
ncbi:hypothetical protein DSAG12_01966 [Promethearchaeum syntrophicum]|uniref:Uncharacterized protein n=1 Tax=Promethearchaeum syntrophicum TaxID=2594042 RepID=A0A5B9DBC2_9ARCH|nr:hypothetical protein [Candidatus Prometheoarchaeum syntrophicum]QEE16137.1 Tetratricopeptide repeat protein [Candidatus Prometheoarchaeum syntrophicum]